jgi:hypothetical protein
LFGSEAAQAYVGERLRVQELQKNRSGLAAGPQIAPAA